MEQQKTLIVIASVALFVAAVIGIGLIFFYPRAEGPSDVPLRVVEEASGRQAFDPIEYLRRPDAESPGFVADPQPADGDLIIIFDEDPRAADRDAPPAPQPVTPEAPIAAVQPEQQPAPSPRPAPSAPTPAPRPAPTPRPTPTQPRTREVRVTEFWIQVIASPSRDRVEQARVRLEENGLRGRVTTRTVNDTVFYRLRVGAYDQREEAEQFLEWICRIDGFGESFISEEYPMRTVSY